MNSQFQFQEGGNLIFEGGLIKNGVNKIITKTPTANSYVQRRQKKRTIVKQSYLYSPKNKDLINLPPNLPAETSLEKQEIQRILEGLSQI